MIIDETDTPNIQPKIESQIDNFESFVSGFRLDSLFDTEITFSHIEKMDGYTIVDFFHWHKSDINLQDQCAKKLWKPEKQFLKIEGLVTLVDEAVRRFPG